MCEVPPINSHTGTQPSTPLISCLVDDMLLQSDHATVRRRFRSAWCPRLYSQLESGPDYSVSTGLGQWNVVLLIFDAVLYTVKYVASFYKVKYEHTKLRCGVLCTCICLKFSGLCFCQKLAKSDDVSRFFQTQCITITCYIFHFSPAELNRQNISTHCNNTAAVKHS